MNRHASCTFCHEPMQLAFDSRKIRDEAPRLRIFGCDGCDRFVSMVSDDEGGQATIRGSLALFAGSVLTGYVSMCAHRISRFARRVLQTRPFAMPNWAAHTLERAGDSDHF